MHAIETNVRYDKKAEFTFVICAFACIIIGSIGISAVYSMEHGISYIFGYASSVLMLIFVAVASSYLILSSRIIQDFKFECETSTGLAYQID